MNGAKKHTDVVKNTTAVVFSGRRKRVQATHSRAHGCCDVLEVTQQLCGKTAALISFNEATLFKQQESTKKFNFSLIISVFFPKQCVSKSSKM